MAPPIVKNVKPNGHGPMDTPDPWLFCVYHKDAYPAGNGKMEAPRKGNGADFDPSSPYRMYHGERVPGFPQHPHCGFETLTATMDGVIDHTDSLGNGGRYGEGDLQWMTAGAGVAHAEMFPLVHSDKPNHTRFFQLWLNLPRADKSAPPAFVMHWADEVPKVTTADGLSTTRVYAGAYEGSVPLAPPPNSWAAKEEADVGVWFVEMKPNGIARLPVASGGSKVNRRIYVVEGEAAKVATSDKASGVRVPAKHMADLDASQEVTLHAEGLDEVHVLVLQGCPIGEPVVQHGPFVGNTQRDIMNAFEKYQNTRFGGWPWKRDDYVFPADKGRFALVDGKELRPTK